MVTIIIENKVTISIQEMTDLDDLFQPFYRGDKDKHEGGTGLGLAISKSILERHNGIIKARVVNGNILQVICRFPNKSISQ